MAESITQKQRSAIERVKAKPSLQHFLFRKAVGLQWYWPLQQAGLLSPANIPAPIPQEKKGSISIPAWPATDYLVSASTELLDPINESYAIEFMNFIRRATRHARDRNFGNYRVWWQFAKILCNVPPALVTQDDLEMIDYWLDDKYEQGLVAEILGEHWAPILLEQTDGHAHELALNLIGLLYKTRTVVRNIGLGDENITLLRIDSWHAKNITNKLAARAGQVLGLRALLLLQNKLETVLTLHGNDEWSSIQRRAIENHAQNSRADDVEDILIEAHRDSLLAYVGTMAQEAKQYVAQLLSGPFATLQRIAIHTVDRRYEELKELTDRILIHDFFESDFRHELWHFLKNRYSLFTLTQKQLVSDIINSIIEREDETGTISEAGTAYRRAIWLSAIREHDENSALLYSQCVQKIGGAPEHPDFSSYFIAGYTSDKTPLSQDELLSFDIPNLVERLRSYVDPGQFGGPGIRGLAKTLGGAIKVQPLKFHKHLKDFIELDLAYVNEIIEAHRELWTEQVQLPWDDIWRQLLEFCSELIQQERFWSPESAARRTAFVANRFWVISSISRLIQSATQSEVDTFPQQYLSTVEVILKLLLEKNEEVEEYEFQSDAVSLAINSPRGQTYEAFISLVLRCCKSSDREHGTHSEVWQRFRPTFERELAWNDVRACECAALTGRNLPQFLYMSATWLQENFASIFDQHYYLKWLCAIQGYSYVNTIYEPIYKYLKASGDFRRALDDQNLQNKTDNKITENIAVAYFHDHEKLEDQDNLIDYLISRKLYPELTHLVWFVWTLRKNEDPEVTVKVIKLWRRFSPLIDPASEEGRKFSNKLCDWIIFIDEVNDSNRDLIYSVVACAEESYSSLELLDNIARISERQPVEAYNIWRKLLKVAYVAYPREAIKLTLENLTREGLPGVQRAKDIASEYLNAGNPEPHEILRQILTTSKN